MLLNRTFWTGQLMAVGEADFAGYRTRQNKVG